MDTTLPSSSKLHLALRLQGRLDPRETEGGQRAAPQSQRAPSQDTSGVHTYPKGVPDWSNLEVLHRNTLKPRSNFVFYDRPEDETGCWVHEPRYQLLSGTWKFHVSSTPLQGPVEFYKNDFDASGWDDIAVPGIWQLQGFGKGPQYTNLDFPWPADPPNIPLDDNECGRYVTTFHVGKETQGCQLRLRFEGVDSAFSVWVNGKKIGYSQGARNPSEFDVTDAIDIGCDNTLAVEVYQRCDGTYLEDQVGLP